MVERDNGMGVARGPNRVCIIWAEEDQEPLKFECLGYHVDGGFALFDIEWFRGHKTLIFPAHRIHTIEVLDEEARASPPNYSESNTFREQPEKSPWFKGMGAEPNG